MATVPKFVTVTDLKYRWKKIREHMEATGEPVIVMEYSKVRAVMVPAAQAEKFMADYVDQNGKPLESNAPISPNVTVPTPVKAEVVEEVAVQQPVVQTPVAPSARPVVPQPAAQNHNMDSASPLQSFQAEIDRLAYKIEKGN